MKYLMLFIFAPLIIASCSSGTNNRLNKDSSATNTAKQKPAISTLSFLKTDGKANQDSTIIKLTLNGNNVTGKMNWLPYQKDSRKGTLKGTRNGDQISATWSFMQEGMKDTMALQFKLQEQRLLQKPLKLNTATGREQSDNTAGYSEVYKLVK